MDALETPPVALLFPGISPSRFADVGRFMLINPVARELVARADEVLGYRLLDAYRDAEGEYAEPARVAFLVNCLALARWARQEGDLVPTACTGPSFGGTPAAVHAGALPFEQAVLLTARWGRVLDGFFAEQYGDVVTQSFARTPPAVLDQVRAELDERGEWNDVACYVDTDFTMISVREPQLEWLAGRIRSLGGLPLSTMRPPMHSASFAPLRDRIEEQLFPELTFVDPQLPIVSDHDGSLLRSAGQVRTLLLDAVVRPVRWPSVVETLKGLGVGRLQVCGQDNLWGRVPCSSGSFQVVTVDPATALRPRRRRAPV